MTRFHGQGATCLAPVIGGSALVLGIAPAAEAAITEYTDKAAFEAALAPGAYAVGAVGPSSIGANDLMSGNADPSFRVFNFSTEIKVFGVISALLITRIMLSPLACKSALMAAPL